MQLNGSSLDRLTPRPVIIGGGLVGLAISRALSGAKVGHVLIGDPPTDAPRLGESLNPEGSLEIVRQFPDLSRFFFAKKQAVLFFGEQALCFDFPRVAAAGASAWLASGASGAPLLHVDRIGFDAALFRSATESDYALFIRDRVTALDYRAATDRVEGVVLASGARIDASYVFDATNHLSLVARAIGVERRTIGEARRVVFAHYRAGDSSQSAQASAARPGWTQATSLLRLEAARNGFEGLAWNIPLGDYVSLGVSVDANVKIGGAALLDAVEAAYARVGLSLRALFPARGAPVDLRYDHYDHARCFGRNWLLAGASCCQIWFPSAAGVATGLIAARLAVDLLRDPQRAGRIYQSFLNQTVAKHQNLDWMVSQAPQDSSAAQVLRQGGAMAGGAAKALASYLGMTPPPVELRFGDALTRFYELDRRLATPVRLEAVRREAQAARAFARLDASDPWTDPAIAVPLVVAPAKLDGPRALLALIDALSGKSAAAGDAALVAPAMDMVIDGQRLAGAACWREWVRTLRASGRVTGLQFAAGALEQSGQGQWRLSGQWRGVLGGRTAVSPQVRFDLTLDGDALAAFSARRADFCFVLGDDILHPPAFVALLAGVAARARPSAA